jgi:hypothetical protein
MLLFGRTVGVAGIAVLAVISCSGSGSDPWDDDDDDGSAVGGSGNDAAGGADGVGGAIDPALPGCYFPCLWELIARCRPVSRCTTEVRGDLEVSCDPDSQWRNETNTVTYVINVTSQTGAPCYTATGVDGIWTYLDGAGTYVATVRYADADSRGFYPVECADGTTGSSNHEAPGCEVFAGPECTPGVCP